MTLAPTRTHSPPPGTAGAPAQILARRLAAAGLGVDVSLYRDTCELTILGVADGKSTITLNTGGRARWYYEPATGTATSPATLTAIITHLLGAPPCPTAPAAYHALPLKGQAGRSLQDQGLTVALQVSEDTDSFEATTAIEVANPARPRLGSITLSDDAALDWHCNWQTAFEGNPATLIDLITPILRPRR